MLLAHAITLTKARSYVAALADRWGVDLLPRGKTAWFEMRVVDR